MKRAYLVCFCLLTSTLYAQSQPAFSPLTSNDMAGGEMMSVPFNVEASSIFREAATYHSGGYGADSIAVADLNGDGHPDLVVVTSCASASSCRGRVGVLLGNGDGTYQVPLSSSSGGYDATSIAVADVNGDGYPDLLVTNSCANSACVNGNVSVLLGNGDGTFRAPVSYNSGGYEATSVAVADVNGDGYPDLLLANYCVSSTNCTNGTVAVLLARGNGTFQAPAIYNSGGSSASSVGVADLTGDGHVDLVVGNDGVVAVLLSEGNGTFQAPVTYDSGGSEVSSVAIADVNHDGIPDLLVSNLCGRAQPCEGSVGVLLGNGDGTLEVPPITRPAATIPDRLRSPM